MCYTRVDSDDTSIQPGLPERESVIQKFKPGKCGWRAWRAWLPKSFCASERPESKVRGSSSAALVCVQPSSYTCYADKRPAVTHANCWAHARSKFDAALKEDPKAANQALALIGQLYKIEEHIRKQQLNGEQKLD